MKLIPIGDNLLVQPGELDTAVALRKAGLVVPDSLKDKPNNGVVISVGEGRVTESGQIRPIPAKAGDKILYTKYGGTPFDFKGVQLLLISTDDVLCKYESEVGDEIDDDPIPDSGEGVLGA